MTAEIPIPGTAARAAAIREQDFRDRGFRDVRIIGSSDPEKHRGFPAQSILVSGRSPCGKILRAGLTGPIQKCGEKCRCVK